METERLPPQQDQEQMRQTEAESGLDTEQEREVERAAEMERTRDMAGSIMFADQWVRESQNHSHRVILLWSKRGDIVQIHIQHATGIYYHMILHTMLTTFDQLLSWKWAIAMSVKFAVQFCYLWWAWLRCIQCSFIYLFVEKVCCELVLFSKGYLKIE